MTSSDNIKTIVIREISPSDTPALYELGLRCFDWTSEGANWNMHMLERFARFYQETSFLAEVNRETIGLSLAYPTEKVGYLAWLAVAPGWRGGKIARQLLDASVHALERYPIEQLYGTARENLLPLFKAWGYEVTNEVKVGVFKQAREHP